MSSLTSSLLCICSDSPSNGLQTKQCGRVWRLQEKFRLLHCRQTLEHAIIVCCSGWLHVLCFAISGYVHNLFNDAAIIVDIIYRNDKYAWWAVKDCEEISRDLFEGIMSTPTKASHNSRYAAINSHLSSPLRNRLRLWTYAWRTRKVRGNYVTLCYCYKNSMLDFAHWLGYIWQRFGNWIRFCYQA
jgi:hypothetical protein